MDLHLFNSSIVNNYHAVCLDGSPSGFYINAKTSRSTSWVIFIEGGGLCYEPVDCLQRAKSNLGSSTHWDKTLINTRNVLSPNMTINGVFGDWNHVFIRYCSGDLHSGIETKESVWGVTFAGHFQIRATLDILIAEHGLKTAKQILLGGDSAGGIAVFSHANFFYDRLPGVPISVLPQAGYFMPQYLTTFPQWLLNQSSNFEPVAWDYLDLFFGDPFIDTRCAAAMTSKGLDVRLCLSASMVAPHVQSRIFYGQNVFDAVQLEIMAFDGFDNGYLTYFGDIMIKSLGERINVTRGDGAWVASCWNHEDDICLLSKTLVRGVTYGDAVTAWYAGTPTVLFDECLQKGTLPCNAVCNGPC